MAWGKGKTASGEKKPSKWREAQSLGSDATLPADAQAQIDVLSKAGLPPETLKTAVDAIRSKFAGENGAKAELLIGIDEGTPDLLKVIVGKSDACFTVAKWRAIIARADFILKSADAAESVLAAAK